ncbi:MAG TPA: efflux transporter outer membrane subunit [Steroidobacteraceae bacterium]|nr:efflux transporter outer membrane subunit [Steroidobacteraceae bacterium]
MIKPHRHHRAARRAVPAAGILLLAGCAVGPNFAPPKAPVPQHWSKHTLQPPPAVPQPPRQDATPPVALASPAAPGVSLAPLSTVEEQPAQLEAWWGAFQDPTLSALIERSLRSNLELRVAVLRTQEALAERDISAAGLWPSLAANASYDRERISESTPEGSLLTTFPNLSIPGVPHISIPNPYNQYQLGATASWELDLFGRLRRTVEAANAAAQVSLEDQRAVRVSLLGEVAQSYLALRGAQARKAVARENLATIGDLLELTRQRHAAGLNTELDVRNAIAELTQTRATLPAFDLQVSEAIHELGVLTDRQPEELRAELDRAAAVPPVPPRVPIGLPAELARRRPDIREAEANLHAATAQIGVAVGNLYPDLTLSAQGAFQSESLGSLLKWGSLFETIGPELDIPIFDRGRWKTVHLYKLKAREAALSYRSTVLNALREVEDAAAAYNADQQQREWLTDTVRQNEIALELARERYQSGLTDFLNVLDALRSLQQNQMAMLASTTAVSTDLVTLYRTLGGGWASPSANR